MSCLDLVCGAGESFPNATAATTEARVHHYTEADPPTSGAAVEAASAAQESNQRRTPPMPDPTVCQRRRGITSSACFAHGRIGVSEFTTGERNCERKCASGNGDC